MKAITVDNFLDPERLAALRHDAVNLPYYNIRFLGAHYNRIHIRSNDEFKSELEALVRSPIDQQHTFLRRNLKGEFSKDQVHHDSDTSEFVAILYLNLPEHCSGGTSLFRHKETGADAYPRPHEIARLGRSPKREQAKFIKDFQNADAWEMTEVLEMKYNRLVLYPCTWFHSRFPREAFGTTPEDARTIWLSFFNVTR